MISYAQAREDVLLWRALSGRVRHHDAFYIDVGAYDPELDSVSKVFYDHGWRGLNVEPVAEFFARFAAERPDEINLQVAVSDHDGEVVFHEIVGHQLSTIESDFADRHDADGMERRRYSVPCMTLAEICARHAPPVIHFLKIDVEGHEHAVVAGMDFDRFRPWILVIEASEPNNIYAPTFAAWDPAVRAGGYTFVHTDRLNRYYVANERPELMEAFALPADDYVRAVELRRISELEEALAAMQDRVAIPPARPNGASWRRLAGRWRRSVQRS